MLLSKEWCAVSGRSYTKDTMIQGWVGGDANLYSQFIIVLSQCRFVSGCFVPGCFVPLQARHTASSSHGCFVPYIKMCYADSYATGINLSHSLRCQWNHSRARDQSWDELLANARGDYYAEDLTCRTTYVTHRSLLSCSSTRVAGLGVEPTDTN